MNLDEAPVPASAPEVVAETVLEIVRDVLGRDEVQLSDDLFNLGFDSLVVVRTAARVRERMGVNAPLSAYFDAGNVAELAATLAVCAKG